MKKDVLDVKSFLPENGRVCSMSMKGVSGIFEPRPLPLNCSSDNWISPLVGKNEEHII